MSFILLIAGLVLLAIAGDVLVRGSVAAAEKLHIPPIIVGLTIVAFGTSAPELIISVDAALHGAPGLAIGNVIGSNIANVLLVLGVPALIVPILFVQPGIRRTSVFMIAVGLLLYALASDRVLSRGDGVILLALLAAYLVSSGLMARKSRREQLQAGIEAETGGPLMGNGRILTYLVFGLVGLAIGGKMTTSGALGVASILGVANSAIGLTIVALGTSLPELAAGVMAAIRRHEAVAIGNVVGSNVFNTLGILGVVSVITPMPVAEDLLGFDFWIMIAASLLLLPFVFRTRRIGPVVGTIMTLAYLGYVYVTLSGIA